MHLPEIPSELFASGCWGIGNKPLLSVSVHYSRAAQQGDGADDREVPVSDAGAQGE